MTTVTEQRTPDPRFKGLMPVDLGHMTRKGWFPATNFAALDALRERHEALIDQRDAKQAAARAVRARFADEDRARQTALNDAYLGGTPAKAKLPKLTSPEQRKAAIDEAEAHAEAAAKAVLAFVREALTALRGCEDLPPGWEPYIRAQSLDVPGDGVARETLNEIATEESELRNAIHEAQRVIDNAELRVRELHPLKAWLAKNGNAGPGQIVKGDDLPIPATHTPGSKPRDLTVPGWWPDQEGNEDGAPVLPEGAEHLIPPDAESAVVEQSDPWFAEQERAQS